MFLKNYVERYDWPEGKAEKHFFFFFQMSIRKCKLQQTDLDVTLAQSLSCDKVTHYRGLASSSCSVERNDTFRFVV